MVWVFDSWLINGASQKILSQRTSFSFRGLQYSDYSSKGKVRTKRLSLKWKTMAGTSLPSSLLSQGPSLLFSSPNQISEAKSPIMITSGKRCLVRCLAKKKISFVDQILDYIEGIFGFMEI